VLEGESAFTYTASTYTAMINNASAKFGVGDFTNGLPLYLGHFKSDSATNANILIQADGDPRIAGVLFKTEDTDDNVRIKGGIFFDNSAGDSFGRGLFKIAINSAGSNTNVSVTDTLMSISTTDINMFLPLEMNGGDLTGINKITMTGDLNGSGTANIIDFDQINANVKNFDIVHPTKGKPWRLQYTSLEGPEAGVYLRGKTTEKVIDLPDYWTGLVHEESITVQLTPIGSPCVHYVVEIKDNKVHIECQDGQPNCYYTIYAERKDVNGPKLEYLGE
jgi:hypothetical protein